MHIQWYPGHMTKARRMMQENIKLIDLVIELVDARVPSASRNPDIDELAKGKSRVIILNKADLADPEENERWKSYFFAQGFEVILCNSKQRKGMRDVSAAVSAVCRAKFERDKKRGILNRPVRAMVVGIPNVGKSTFINAFAGKACTKTGNRPGVTKGKQWIRLNKQVELLDTPGILWPRFEDQIVGKRLAMIGSIKEELLDCTELAAELLGELERLYPGAVIGKYLIDSADIEVSAGSGSCGSFDDSADSADFVDSGEDVCETAEIKLPGNYELLRRIALSRNCILKGNEPDMEKAARLLLDDFQNGRIARMSLEISPASVKHESE